jgi:hypothetical protein
VYGKVEHKRLGDSFVDDTTTGTTNDYTTMEPVPVEEEALTWSEEELVAKMQDIIRFFLDVLQVTRGHLASAKCAWYLICHRLKNGKARLLQVKETHRGVNITSRATGRISGVKRKSVEEGHRWHTTPSLYQAWDMGCLRQHGQRRNVKIYRDRW